MKKKQNKTNFLRVLGDTPEMRVIDFFLDNYLFDYPMSEISRESNVSFNSLKRFFPDYLKRKILIKTRRIGKSNYYKVNENNLFIKRMLQIDMDLTFGEIPDKLKKKQLVTA